MNGVALATYQFHFHHTCCYCRSFCSKPNPPSRQWSSIRWNWWSALVWPKPLQCQTPSATNLTPTAPPRPCFKLLKHPHHKYNLWPKPGPHGHTASAFRSCNFCPTEKNICAFFRMAMQHGLAESPRIGMLPAPHTHPWDRLADELALRPTLIVLS